MIPLYGMRLHINNNPKGTQVTFDFDLKRAEELRDSLNKLIEEKSGWSTFSFLVDKVEDLRAKPYSKLTVGNVRAMINDFMADENDNDTVGETALRIFEKYKVVKLDN